MRLLYNLLQLLCAPILFLLLLLLHLRRPEKSRLILPRLGIGLKHLKKSSDHSPTIWIHALSVGEVTSAIALVEALRKAEPSAILVFSATTASGMRLANAKVLPLVDTILPFPFDILPVVTHFLKRIQPDLFILVETDFWPNLMAQLLAQKVPALLVNGRISEKSMRSYQRFSFFFRPIFDQFQLLCMQSVSDIDNMRRLGIAENKLQTLGNLKYAQPTMVQAGCGKASVVLSPGHLMIICGSTHKGEEDIILSAYSDLLPQFKHVHLAIAPRNIDRSREILEISHNLGLATLLYSKAHGEVFDVLIVDTIGDLVSLYSTADIAFVGGSLVAEGGHNPLEAAHQSLPILFGRHMEDFSEISEELLHYNAAFEVPDQASLTSTLKDLIVSEEMRHTAGRQAKLCTEMHQDIIPALLEIIRRYL